VPKEGCLKYAKPVVSRVWLLRVANVLTKGQGAFDYHKTINDNVGMILKEDWYV
jgi:hypothetical protein